MDGSNLLIQVDTIDVNDLVYVERDLNFRQKVGLCFLLFSDVDADAAFILQKLLAMAGGDRQQPSDLLTQYSKSRPDTWRRQLVEALCIIGARQVLRKLGFRWTELRLHYLPHIAGISLHVHPLLKSLYRICEDLTMAQSGRLILEVSEKVGRQQAGAGDPLRFYDTSFLEIFLLDWLTRRCIRLGDLNATGSDVQLLIEHLKFNDMQEQAKLLIDTINSNAQEIRVPAPASPLAIKRETLKDSQTAPATASDSVPATATASLRRADALQLSRENAGIALIINQRQFHRNVSPELKMYLSPKKLESRVGTDVDERRLGEVFSSMGYQVESHPDVDHMDMVHLIRNACSRSAIRDSLVVCILSHGFEGTVYGANSIALRISELENVLCSDDASLYDQSHRLVKLLFIQACQTEPDKKLEQDQHGLPYPLDATTQSPGQHLHMLRANSTVKGFSALRHTHNGSWFIQSLCDNIVQHSSSTHIADILMNVTRDVSGKRGKNNESMVPDTNIRMTQHVYLPPRCP
ncbi:caspase-8 [Drosophila kikkawai]|uniref:Caspase-8 n=1 Tax=Drosophila kikkawai TaxID=30033 RepID=A0A6P4HQ37_DROKI|nr:caspase-8 [Drosophila kikkawai]